MDYMDDRNILHVLSANTMELNRRDWVIIQNLWKDINVNDPLFKVLTIEWGGFSDIPLSALRLMETMDTIRVSLSGRVLWTREIEVLSYFDPLPFAYNEENESMENYELLKELPFAYTVPCSNNSNENLVLLAELPFADVTESD